MRRGGGGGGATTTTLTIFDCNLRGYNSKRASIDDILNRVQPDICTFQETGLFGNNTIKIKNYHSSLRNRKGLKKAGGVCTAVANYLKPHVVKVKEGDGEDEYLITRLDNVHPALNIVNIYGGQECRMGKQEVLESWGRLKVDLDLIKERDENCLLIGDVNRAIGSGKFGIPNNHPRISYGGRLVRELLEEQEYTLVNGLDLVEGGPWTWESAADNTIKSCIDIVMVSAGLLPYVDTMKIDSKRRMTPARVSMKNGKSRLIPPDHYPLMVVLKNLPTKIIRRDQECSWNLQKPGGWDAYEKLSDENNEKMDAVIEDESLNIENVMRKIEAMDNKLKFKAFGKTRPRTTRSRRKMEERIKAARGMEDENGPQPAIGMDDGSNSAQGLENENGGLESTEWADELRKKQSKYIGEAIDKIKTGKVGNITSVFRMRDLVAGPKKQIQEAHAVKDPNSGELVVSNEEIKRVNLEHCLNILKDKEPKEEVKLLIKLESDLHDLLMETTTDKDLEISEEDYDDVIIKFKRKNKRSYDFLIKAGDLYRRSIFKLCRRMLKEESFPDSFFETTLQQLWKKKGSRQDLGSYRYLHVKRWAPKLVEALTVKDMKDDIIENGNKFCIGGIPGHRPQEHLISIKCIIGFYIRIGLGIILQLVDIQRFFDSEHLRGVMRTLGKARINMKSYRNWFKLNEKIVLRVKTSAGLTEKGEAYERISQGSQGAGLASGADIAQGLEDYFKGSKDEVTFGSVRCNPQGFVDDIARAAQDVASARIGNIKLHAMMEDKLLTCHPTKTCYVVVGTPKFREKILAEVEDDPIMFGDFACKSQTSEVYLGDVISSLGLEASVELTIQRRLGLVRGAMYETKAIMEDYRMQAVGGMSGAWTIWERAICPRLLNNCGTWVGIGQKAIKILNKVQNEYLRCIYACPPSTPIPALRAMAGMLDMEHRIWHEKVSLVTSILFCNPDQDSYAREMLLEELEQGWEGLSMEVQQICKLVGLPDGTSGYISRKDVTEAITLHHMKTVKDEMTARAPKKLVEMRNLDCRKEQQYMKNASLHDSRLEFQWQANMLDTRTTMGNKYQRKSCPHCKEGLEEGLEESPLHMLEVCPAYADLRFGLDPLYITKDRAVFLRQAIVRRKLLEKEL